MTYRKLLRVLAESVLLPIAAFILLSALGVAPLWALVGSAATSVVVVALGYQRTGSLPTLGLLVLVRFAAGIAVALITEDARLTLAKDPAFTGVVGVAAAATLVWGRPLTARICRDLSEDAARFEQLWSGSSAYRRQHRRLTLLWVVGLLAESAVAFTIVYRLDFATAVVLTRLLTPVVIIGLSGWTQYRVRAVERAVVPLSTRTTAR